MRPLVCRGGYPIPIGVGKYEIWGVGVTASNTAAATRCTFFDDDSFKEIGDGDSKDALIDLKGLANADGFISIFFAEPIKTRKGITIANGTNLLAGRNFVYIR